MASIVDGRTVNLSNGTNVLLSGLAQAGACWTAASVEFATKTLVDKTVKVVSAQLLLADGQNDAVLAAGKGVRWAESGTDEEPQAAEAAAWRASAEFSGPSCSRLDVKVAPQSVAPQPVVPQPRPQT
ncbi:hypothetical protein ACWGE0_36685 [Lentzea sp. NPDC054927]